MDRQPSALGRQRVVAPSHGGGEHRNEGEDYRFRRRFSMRASDDLDGKVLIGSANGERVAGEQPLALRDQGNGVPPSAL